MGLHCSPSWSSTGPTAAPKTNQTARLSSVPVSSENRAAAWAVPRASAPNASPAMKAAMKPFPWMSTAPP